VTETKFTPGPWAIREASFDGEYEVYPIRPGEDLEGFGEWAAVATVSEGGDDEPAKANAHLIAAAPEMLEALRAVEDSGVLIGRGNEAVGKEAMSLVRAALSKALGKEG
jgi:hypothetical protein